MKKPSLTKAAASVSSISPAAAAPVSSTMANTSQLHPSPTNPRKHFDEAELQDLADSLRTLGMIQPIVVRPESMTAKLRRRGSPAGTTYEIVAGEKRFRAAQIAKLQTVPVIIRQLTDLEVLDLQAAENEQRSDIRESEKAAHFQRMLDAGRTIEQIAEGVSRSASTVRSTLNLLRAPKIIREAVDSGRLPSSVAQLVCRIPDQGTREKLACHVLMGWHWWQPDREIAKAKLDPDCEPLSYRQVEELISRSCMRQLKGAPFDRSAVNLVVVRGSCDDCRDRAGNRQKADPEDCRGLRADTCTNPTCFQMKVEAAAKLAVEQAKAQGRKVMSAGDANKIFESWNGTTVSQQAGWLDLDATDYRNGRTYRQLLKEDLSNGLGSQVAIAVDREGRSHDLVPKAAASSLIKKRHGSSAASDRGGDRHAAKRKEEEKINAELRKRLLERVSDAAEIISGVRDDTFQKFWKALGTALAGEFWSEVTRKTEARRGRSMADELAMLGTTGIFGLLAEMVACKALGWNDDDNKLYKPFWAALDLDPAAERKQIVAEMKDAKRDKADAQAKKDKRRLINSLDDAPAGKASGRESGVGGDSSTWNDLLDTEDA